MDPPEQALAQVGATALAAPSAAVAGLVAASIAENTKRTYAAALKRLDASLALYLARLHAAGLSPAVAAMAVAANDGGSVAGLRDAALLAVASDGLLRVSEVAALDVGDVQAEADGSGRLSVNAIRRVIRSRAAAVGIKGRVSGHSLRVGGAQSLAAGGASIVEMQTAGRWQSPAMPGHYARGQLAARGAVARVRYGRG